jgi:hypothetical protein
VTTQALRSVWARIPGVECKGLCTDSCTSFLVSDGEDKLLQSRGIIMDPPKRVLHDPDYRCPALVKGRCTVYRDRPTVCRLYGVVARMPCPHGCVPDELLDDASGFALLELANQAGGGVAGRLMAP